MSVPDFSQSDLLQQAQGNAMATLLGTMAYLKRGGGSLPDWARFLGEQFAPSWSEATGWDATRLAQTWALNFVSVGATVQSLEGDAKRADVVVTNWPAQADLESLDLTREDVDPFLAICQPIMAFVGAHADWSREGDRIRFIVSR